MYRDRERGGGRIISKTKNYKIKSFREGIIGRHCILPGCPFASPLSTTFKYYQRQSQGGRPQEQGYPGSQIQGETARNGWIPSETGGQLKFTSTDGAVTPRNEQSWNGVKGRVEHNRAGPDRVRLRHFGWREIRRGERRREWRATGGGVR